MCNLIFINYLLSKANKFYKDKDFIKEDDLNQALFYVNRALSIEKFPSNELLCEAYFLRGKIHWSLKNYNESILDFDKTIKIEKEHYLALYYRGKAKKELSFFDEALEDIDNAIRLKSNERDFFVERALLKIKLKLFSGALDDFDNAINIDHNSSFIFF